MPPNDDGRLPSVGEALAPVLMRVQRQQQPVLIALAERLAARRYRDWASQIGDAARRPQLLACADREEDIAARVEGLFADAKQTQDALLAAHSDVEEINQTLFAGRPLAQQFTIQAEGERLGAATWRSFARAEESADRRAVYLACAELEEASAVVLESILAAGPA